MLSIRKSRSKVKSLMLHSQIRFRKKDRAPKITSTKRTQEYFDSAYPPIYGRQWPSIRIALLSKQKYMAVVNNFANFKPIEEDFQERGAVDIRSKYSLIVEQMKNKKEQRKEQMSKESEQSTSQDQSENEDSKLIRPSCIELDDDELAAQAKVDSTSRYPKVYQERALAKDHYPGALQLDQGNRLVLPSEMGSGEVNVMMDYMPATKLKGLEDWTEETDVFHGANKGDHEIGLTKEIQEEPINLPSMLKIYSFDKGDINTFPEPKMDQQMKVLDHYALDGASLLPVLALDLAPGDQVLDLCAAPGGKTLIALQSLLPGLVVCNDVSERRVKRIRSVLKQFIPHGVSSIENVPLVTQGDGCVLQEREAYDKVLVDVPCLTDRHSLQEDENSIFKPARTKERLRLPELQSQLLVSALQAVRPGGIVVYSTCTLSPLQNDGAVHLALTRIWEETSVECSVIDMSYAVRPLKFLYRFGSNLGLRYGQIILPSLLSNYGPMYCAKIKRLR